MTEDKTKLLALDVRGVLFTTGDPSLINPQTHFRPDRHKDFGPRLRLHWSSELMDRLSRFANRSRHHKMTIVVDPDWYMLLRQENPVLYGLKIVGSRRLLVKHLDRFPMTEYDPEPKERAERNKLSMVGQRSAGTHRIAYIENGLYDFRVIDNLNHPEDWNVRRGFFSPSLRVSVDRRHSVSRAELDAVETFLDGQNTPQDMVGTYMDTDFPQRSKEELAALLRR